MKYPKLSLILFFITIYLAILLADKLQTYFNKDVSKYRKRIRKRQLSKKSKSNKTLYQFINKNNIGSSGKLEDYFNKSQLVKKAKTKMRLAGDTRDNAYMLYILLSYILPILLFISGVLRSRSLFSIDTFLAFYLSLGYQLYVLGKIKNQEKVFKKEAYQIYKFLSNQISSGIRHVDAVKNVYKVVDNPVLKERFKKLSATYAATSNMELALKNINDYYKCFEARSLAIVIMQGVKTGFSKDMIDIKERTMFNQYLNMVKLETETFKMKGFLIAVVYAGIITILLMMPILNQLFQAQYDIFMY